MTNCVMTRLGKCSYEETGCSDCRIISMCEEAIQKQITQNVVYKMDCHGGALCPSCRTVFEYRMDNWKSPFCQYCGQALCWEEK